MKVPKQLQNPAFRFVLIRKGTKSPIGKGWQVTNNYRYYDPELSYNKIYGIECGDAVGVVCGFGNLYVVDFDDQATQDKLLKKLPETFAVKTGGKGLLHLYFLSKETPESFKIVEKGKTLADIQGVGKQVIMPGSIHSETSRMYEIEKDVSIAQFDIKDLKELFREYNVLKHSSGLDGSVADDIIKCPFHNDTNPSLAIYREDGTFFCFGCHAYGLLHIIGMQEKGYEIRTKRTKNGIFHYYDKEDEDRYKTKLSLKKQETTIQPDAIFSRRGQLETFWQKQPFFYDKSKIFYLWNKELCKWEISDEVDFLNAIQKHLGIETITTVVKNELISGFQQIGRSKRPKDTKSTWVQFKNIQ